MRTCAVQIELLDLLNASKNEKTDEAEKSEAASGYRKYAAKWKPGPNIS